MKHLKRVTVSKAQFFEGVANGDPVTYAVWVGSIIYFFKDYTDF